MSCYAQTSDKSSAIQTFINVPELDKYFHPELENRIPLYLLNNKFIEEDIKLQKFGRKVRVVKDTTGTNGNYIKITKLVLENNQASIAFYYKIQNISVTGTLEKNNGRWQVTSHKILQF